MALALQLVVEAVICNGLVAIASWESGYHFHVERPENSSTFPSARCSESRPG